MFPTYKALRAVKNVKLPQTTDSKQCYKEEKKNKSQTKINVCQPTFVYSVAWYKISQHIYGCVTEIIKKSQKNASGCLWRKVNKIKNQDLKKLLHNILVLRYLKGNKFMHINTKKKFKQNEHRKCLIKISSFLVIIDMLETA